jgi:hypothetical protein
MGVSRELLGSKMGVPWWDLGQRLGTSQEAVIREAFGKLFGGMFGGCLGSFNA